MEKRCTFYPFPVFVSVEFSACAHGNPEEILKHMCSSAGISYPILENEQEARDFLEIVSLLKDFIRSISFYNK